MVIITKEPDKFVECKVCNSLLSYNWKQDVKKRDVKGSMSSLPSTLYYIECPICKHQVIVLKTL
jgi:ribosomal protein S27E